MPDYDVHFLYSGTIRIGAATPEHARALVDERLHTLAHDLDQQHYLNVADPDRSYATDVLETD
jgi:hypothetical protein